VLAAELRKSRLAAGLTQEELAAKAGLSREYVNYLERGRRSPTVTVFIKLCFAMNVYPPDLLARILPAGKRRSAD
jgi:transcriptional regulator with XRE-family HTH domain